MASNLLLIVFLVLFSLSLTSVYSLSTRDVVLIQEDESYIMATKHQGSSMIDIEDLAKGRSLQSLVAGSKVVVNKKDKKSKSTSEKSSKKKETPKSKKVGSFKSKKLKIGSLAIPAFVGIIIAAIVLPIVIICVLCLFCLRHKKKKAQSTGQEKTKGSSETQTSKTDDHV